MEDSIGRCCEPLSADGYHEIFREFTFNKPRPIKIPEPVQHPKLEPVDPISTREMFDICAKAAHRMLSSNEMKILISLSKVPKPERNLFEKSLDLSMQQCGRFNVQHLEQLILQQYNHQ